MRMFFVACALLVASTAAPANEKAVRGESSAAVTDTHLETALPSSGAPIGTPQTPFVVSTVETREDELERLEAAKHRTWERESTKLQAYIAATVAIFALLQLLLFFWQLRLMRETVKDAGSSARAASSAASAASLSAKAAVQIELPIITASVFGLLRTSSPTDPYDPQGGSVNDGFPDRYASVGPFLFKNSGRSSALLETLELGWAVGESLPPQPVYQHVIPLEHFSIIGPGEEFQSPYHLAIELDPHQQAEIKEARSLLWVYGSLRYRDFIGDVHKDAFCFNYEKRPRGHLNPFAFFKDRRPPAAYTNHEIERSLI